MEKLVHVEATIANKQVIEQHRESETPFFEWWKKWRLDWDVTRWRWFKLTWVDRRPVKWPTGSGSEAALWPRTNYAHVVPGINNNYVSLAVAVDRRRTVAPIVVNQTAWRMCVLCLSGCRLVVGQCWSGNDHRLAKTNLSC